ncbi:MAG: hypothetical protein ACU836_08585 [Gammaproteobacteria bacterium]
MQRCPACDARLNDESFCTRCGADLSRIRRCERLAEQWLSVSLKSLHAGRFDVAIPAIIRSLSFKQTPQALLAKGFVIQQQYQTFYQTVGTQCWQEARDILSRLRMLQGQNEALRYLDALIKYLSSQSESSSRRH